MITKPTSLYTHWHGVGSDASHVWPPCVWQRPRKRAGLEGQIRGRVARCGPSKSDVQAQMLLTRAAHMTSGDKQHALEKRAAHAGMEWHKSCGVKACMVQRSKGKCTRRSLLLTETSCPRNTPRLRRGGEGRCTVTAQGLKAMRTCRAPPKAAPRVHCHACLAPSAMMHAYPNHKCRARPR